MARIISISIDLMKIDKSKIISGKNGAQYYNLLVTVNDEKDKYDNDCSVTDSQTKEQRDAKEKKIYLGNGRTIWTSDKPKESKNAESKPQDKEEGDGLPF